MGPITLRTAWAKSFSSQLKTKAGRWGEEGGRHSGEGTRWEGAVKSLLQQLLKTTEVSLLHGEAVSDRARELETSAGCWAETHNRLQAYCPLWLGCSCLTPWIVIEDG